ncbi:PLP-dependent aminotransferase family protein [Cupriavidus gilardii]|uniref:MocR-like pyridoxine biosynthesis transcription factor PdxR n=1 Tax=Cupriavidus gilardii TaxID=82541 RepID=UPI001574D9CC|nr:PLP-dependent aminotransferase family protein [Cupriavidus gilardii]NSX04693.1 PLP-dependent aminotransferase family protein [Cupriavidus gilardii]
MDPRLDVSLDRSSSEPLSAQIASNLRVAIRDGRLAPGARLPSWRDLAARLGVGRGTVRSAYERLLDERLIVTAGAAGTRVVAQPARVDSAPPPAPTPALNAPLSGILHDFSAPPLPFEMGVPAQDAFPAKLWSRLRARALRTGAMSPVTYPDPRGAATLRAQLASYLAIARGIHCAPDQIILTAGYRGGLGLTLTALQLAGRTAWIEEPGYMVTRSGLELAGVRAVPIPVDAHGIDAERGLALAPDAALAVVTPGQQAPTGVPMSPARRQALLRWAVRAQAWIVEDDYLSELQLQGRVTPALAAGDRHGRVIHIGTFSKTMSPSLGLGFVVAPLALAERFAEVAGCLAPAPNLATQLAFAEFMAEGHYLRHLRHMKALYAQRRDALLARLGPHADIDAMGGLAVRLRLPSGCDDRAIAAEAVRRGMAPSPVSRWYAHPQQHERGLLLGITNLSEARLAPACDTLMALLADMR